MKIITAEFDSSSSIYAKSYGYEGNSLYAHWGRGSRDAFILHYVVEGEGYFNSRRVKCGQGFLITPGMMHEYHTSQERPWKYFWVIFSGKDAEHICKKYIDSDEQGVFSFAQFELQVIDLFDHILLHSELLTEARALGYFYMLLSCHEARPSVTGNHYVQQAEKYMKTHIYREISITEVARAVGISDRYMYNLFVKHYCISPKQYLNRLRLTRAQELLKKTNDTVSEMTFSRFFKKNIGISPTEFRKQATRLTVR